MCKFKFLNFKTDYSHEDLLNDFKIVDNPTTWNNLPDGEYLIRGDKKDHSKTYWVKDNVWYLVESKTKDNGHFYCYAASYLLFPNLPEKDWELLNKVFSKLTPYWKRAVAGRNHYMELRELRRNIKKHFLIYNSMQN